MKYLLLTLMALPHLSAAQTYNQSKCTSELRSIIQQFIVKKKAELNSGNEFLGVLKNMKDFSPNEVKKLDRFNPGYSSPANSKRGVLSLTKADAESKLGIELAKVTNVIQKAESTVNQFNCPATPPAGAATAKGHSSVIQVVLAQFFEFVTPTCQAWPTYYGGLFDSFSSAWNYQCYLDGCFLSCGGACTCEGGWRALDLVGKCKKDSGA